MQANEECEADPDRWLFDPCCAFFTCTRKPAGEEPPDAAACNAFDIIPPDAPIAFTATFDAGACDATATIVSARCYATNGAGKVKNKGRSCVISFGDDTMLISDSGGVGDNIEWIVETTNRVGVTTETTCSIRVRNPNGNGNGSK